MMAFRTDRQIIEAMLPSDFFWAVIVDGVADIENPANRQVVAWLDAATMAELEGLTPERRGKLIRRARRIFAEALAEFRRQGMEAGKFGLIAYYLFAALRDAGLFHLVDGSALDLALEAILPAVTEWADIPEVDASAQKQARRLLKVLQGEGYYREAVSA